jgi:hypothetical protein
MRDMTPDEIGALAGIADGDLEPLADLLAQEQDELHFTISRALVRLIRGDKAWTDYRLKLERHPDLKAGEATKAEKHTLFRDDMEIVGVMVANGALEKGGSESAISAAIEKTGKSRSSVQRAWRRRKAFIKFTRAHGI